MKNKNGETGLTINLAKRVNYYSTIKMEHTLVQVVNKRLWLSFGFHRRKW